MKKFAFAVAALALVSLNVQAQTYTPVQAKNHRFIAGMGFTSGGDTLATASYTDGASQNIKTGGMLAFYGGVEYDVAQDLAIQATIGYHVDQAHADNGEIRFGRYPLEVLAAYKLSPQWRFGGGVRFVNSPRLSSSGAGDIGDFNFKNTVGAVLEGEYLFSPAFGVKLRYVSEKYEPKNGAGKLDANHVGIMGNFYF